MTELVHGFSEELLEFVASCRRVSYRIGAVPNMATNRKNDYGFRFQRNDLVFEDVSRDNHGFFSGYELVERIDGRPIYSIQYLGGLMIPVNEAAARMVDVAQHGIVLANPTTVRFGLLVDRLTFEVDGVTFVYRETYDSPTTLWDGQGYISNHHETMLRCDESTSRQTIVYRGSTMFTRFPEI